VKYAQKFTLALAATALVGFAAGCDGGGKKAPPKASGGGSAPSRADDGGAAPAGGGAKFDASKATATIKVTATGPATKRRPMKMDADPKCGEAVTGTVLSEVVIVNDGKLQNAIVWVSKGAEAWSFDTPGESIVLDQKGCQYIPHVFTMMVDQNITIKNSDPTMHNVHAVPSKKGGNKKSDFNESQLPGAPDLNKTFSAVEESGLYLKCDVHGWMKTYAGVYSHPFHGVTGADGTVSLPKLPAGEYTISVWHEKLTAPATQTVTLEDGKTTELTFAFTK
jgi:hypothetical protein